jgi:ubiquinone biosynthesis UbiH/UbiF/VisC/COQ6 family hydroxylase
MRVILADGSGLRASLVVAADSRFSEVRRRLGISARMRDFGKTMLVCRMRHEQPHCNTAWEWFDYGQTLALLPLSGNRSSVVITVSGSEACRLQGLSPAAFGAELRDRFRGRVGDMRLISPVFAYPLVAVMPDAFVARRCALVGDAAVGMHPVTAHGFNLGLLGAARLANLIDSAALSGEDVGSPRLLASYERAHRRATVPLYLATNAIAALYTDERLPVRVLRDALVRLGNGIPPFKRAIAASLTRRLA